MLTIRLQRLGKKKQPTYRLVISEKSRDTQAKSLEILGHYNPTQNPKIIELKAERIKYWLNQGAQCSNTVHNLLVSQGIIEGQKKKSIKLTAKRIKKIAEKKKQLEEAKKAEQEAKETKEENSDKPEKETTESTTETEK